jgi:hypothetical protein
MASRVRLLGLYLQEKSDACTGIGLFYAPQ